MKSFTTNNNFESKLFIGLALVPFAYAVYFVNTVAVNVILAML